MSSEDDYRDSRLIPFEYISDEVSIIIYALGLHL